MKEFIPKLRSPRPKSRLGVMFEVCFVTGFAGHEIQHPATSFRWPVRPEWLYRMTQGTHVATGLASSPLLLAKLRPVSRGC